MKSVIAVLSFLLICCQTTVFAQKNSQQKRSKVSFFKKFKKDKSSQKEGYSSDKESQKKPSYIQVALLLDTSNSMDGLIEQTKTQLWEMVNELSLVKDKNYNPPQLEIALYEYGNDRLSESDGFIRMVSPLTTDLDLISEALFGLRTSGGDEYCGHVIKKAVNQLEWSDNDSHLKIIFIAGNEAFTQGNIDYKQSCEEAKDNNIIINTIFCSKKRTSVNGGWQEGARIAQGSFMIINQNQSIVAIDAPQDIRIRELNTLLNDTYIGYGAEGRTRKEMQIRQDSNSQRVGSANMAQRSISKSYSNYKNSNWDLVDARKERKVSLQSLKKKELPKEMQEMTETEMEEYINKKQNKRNEIQKEIRELNLERRAYVDKKRVESAKKTDSQTLDAIITIIRKQVQDKGFSFADE